MGFLSSLFTGGAVAEKATDAVIAAGDKLIYTAEEQTEDQIAASKDIRDWFLKWQEFTSPQNVARRVLAFAIVGTWLALLWIAVVAGYFDRAEGSYSLWLFLILRDLCTDPYNIVLAFYFAAHLMRSSKWGK